MFYIYENKADPVNSPRWFLLTPQGFSQADRAWDWLIEADPDFNLDQDGYNYRVLRFEGTPPAQFTTASAEVF